VTSDTRASGTAVSGRNWLQWTVYAVGITSLTLLDMFIALGQWRALFFLAVAIVGSVTLRRTLPVWVIASISLSGTVAMIATSDPAGFSTSIGIGESFVLVILIVIMFRRAAGRSGWLQVALLVIALLCVPLRVLSPDTATFEVLFLAATGCALAAGAVLRNLDSERQLALAVATQNERDGLARDLHDDFTNRVTGMILMVQAMRRSADSPHSELDDELARVEAAGAEALGSMRRWVATLRAGDVETNRELGAMRIADIGGLVAQWEATSHRGRARLVDSTRVAVPLPIQTTVYRIVQEAITNASRHAPTATWLDVSISDNESTLSVRVLNPQEAALGVDPVPGSAGLGILGMKERAAAVGGSVDAGPADSATWSVTATIPLVDAR